MVDLTHLPQMVVLFSVVFGPLAVFAVFFAPTGEMTAALLLPATLVRRDVIRTVNQGLSTTPGPITLAWGVRSVTGGLTAILKGAR